MSTQKIALFTPTGKVGISLAEEALERGHNVTAIVSNENEFKLKHPNLKVIQGDATKKEVVSRYAKGHDVIICTHEPTIKNPQEHVSVTRNVIEGAKEAGIHHIVAAAHPFEQRMEGTQEFYKSFRPVIQAQQEALKLLQKENGLSWGYLHSVEPTVGKKPGEYVISNEAFLSQPTGQSRVSLNNYTSAVIDEAEKGQLATHELHEREDGMGE